MTTTDDRRHRYLDPADAAGELLGRRQPNTGLIARHLRAAASR